jgi:precorrin-6B methylase 1
LGLCLLGILITNTVRWAKIERASVGGYTRAALPWMFRKAGIPWNELLVASVKVILRGYQVVQGMLVVDDSKKKRAKSTKRIYRAHKMKDKKTGGYINGQSLMVLLSGHSPFLESGYFSPQSTRSTQRFFEFFSVISAISAVNLCAHVKKAKLQLGFNITIPAVTDSLSSHIRDPTHGQ